MDADRLTENSIRAEHAPSALWARPGCFTRAPWRACPSQEAVLPEREEGRGAKMPSQGLTENAISSFRIFKYFLGSMVYVGVSFWGRRCWQELHNMCICVLGGTLWGWGGVGVYMSVHPRSAGADTSAPFYGRWPDGNVRSSRERSTPSIKDKGSCTLCYNLSFQTPRQLSSCLQGPSIFPRARRLQETLLIVNKFHNPQYQLLSQQPTPHKQ